MSDPQIEGVLGSTNAPNRMKLLTAVGYKDGMVYVRQIDRDLFLWDAVWQNQLYSSFIVVVPEEGKDLPQEAIDNARQMCYAGACATIDYQRGDELSEEDRKKVEMFEANREKITGEVKKEE